MPRFKALIEYLGTGFNGWTRGRPGWTPSGPKRPVVGVSDVLEAALGSVKKIPMLPVVASGRTDTGVHATGQVVHFDMDDPPVPNPNGTSMLASSGDIIAVAANSWLKNRAPSYPVAIRDCQEVDSSFHARYDAKARTYTYHILENHRSVTGASSGFNRLLDPALHLHERAWMVAPPNAPLDIDAMREASKCLVGEEIDFTSFRSSGCEAKTPVRTMFRISIDRTPSQGTFSVYDDDLPWSDDEWCLDFPLRPPSLSSIRIQFTATAYLYHQVRNMVGALVMVGSSRWPVERVESVLHARTRLKALGPAPAHGLYLTRVHYSSLPK